jgi:hypothetical protein
MSDFRETTDKSKAPVGGQFIITGLYRIFSGLVLTQGL